MLPGVVARARDRGRDAQSYTAGWFQTLDLFGVAFFAYEADGRRRYLSAAATALLNVEACGLALGQQADTAAAAALRDCGRTLHIGECYLMRQVASLVSGVDLAVHILKLPNGAEAIVVLRPSIEAGLVKTSLPGLTPRESGIARLIAAGLSTKEIAARLGISPHTVRHHTERVFEKLGVRNRASLTAVIGSRRSTGQSVRQPINHGDLLSADLAEL
jgi:DNA-binding CsgD family transcriptional regulator